MSQINLAVYELFENSVAANAVRNFVNDVQHNPKQAASTAINVSSLVAAIHHLYKSSKNSDDKLAAIFNALPAASMKAFAVAMAGHSLSDLATGNYSVDPKYAAQFTANAANKPGQQQSPLHNLSKPNTSSNSNQHTKSSADKKTNNVSWRVRPNQPPRVNDLVKQFKTQLSGK